MAVRTPRPADPAQVQHAVRAAAQALERDVDDVADEVTRALRDSVPDIPGDEQARAFIRRAALESIEGLMRTVVRGAPVAATETSPATAAYVREIARSGQGTRPLLRIIHLTHRVVLEAWGQRLADL
ncbi:MAG TPA: hypothetical protein VGJ70_25850, partial [Solirubrobacteraceae bacterium]